MPDSWIERGAPVNWPARFHRITFLDFFLMRGLSKERFSELRGLVLSSYSVERHHKFETY